MIKQSELDDFVNFLKTNGKNKFYISEEFINWLVLKKLMSEFEATDVFENVQKRIHRKIESYIDSCNQGYLISEFQYDEFDKDTLIGGKFTYNKADRSIISNKLKFRDSIFELLKKIDWRELEKLSKLILHANHINDITVTRSSKDQGIDFYGIYKFEARGYLPRFYKYLNFRILGQVKHSEKNIGVDHKKVASFGTEINILRKSKQTNYFENLSEDFLASELPVVGIFITNSYYPQKAIDFAKEYGIIYWNGKQIAEDLCTQEIIESLFDINTQELNLELLKKKIDELVG